MRRLINLIKVEFVMENLKITDPEILKYIELERERLNNGLQLIPSENIVSKAVLEALGTELTNKYSEGYPGKRYYAGNEIIDEIEKIAVERAKRLFGCEHVNVQPYSGTPANLEVYSALLNPGDKILSMSLAHGGHLSHGHKITFAGKNYTIINYGVTREGFIDYEQVRELALKEKPKLILSGASAYPREINFKKFYDISKEVNAYSMADISHIAGLVATGLHQSPFPFTDVVTTTTHKTLRGPRGAIIMCKKEFADEIDKAVFPGMQGGPHNNVNAAKAVAFKEALQPKFKIYCKQIIKNSKKLAQILMENDFNLVSNGTDNHLILVDLGNKNISGGDAQELLEKANIYVNKNMVPYDKRNPLDPSGIRLGTPSVTTRGMKEEEIQISGNLIVNTLSNKNIWDIKKEVINLCNKFPIYS